MRKKKILTLKHIYKKRNSCGRFNNSKKFECSFLRHEAATILILPFGKLQRLIHFFATFCRWQKLNRIFNLLLCALLMLGLKSHRNHKTLNSFMKSYLTAFGPQCYVKFEGPEIFFPQKYGVIRRVLEW
jgi:hypothetical protein